MGWSFEDTLLTQTAISPLNLKLPVAVMVSDEILKTDFSKHFAANSISTIRMFECTFEKFLTKRQSSV